MRQLAVNLLLLFSLSSFRLELSLADSASCTVDSNFFSQTESFLDIQKNISEIIPVTSFQPPYICDPHSSIPLFQSDRALTVKIQSKYFNRSRSTKRRFSGIISLQDSETSNSSIPITLESRGNNRFYKCSTKPLKITLSKSKFNKKESLFHRLDDELKIVQSCKKDDLWEQKKLLREYQQYKLLECLGLPHFKVRLFNGQFLDSKGKTDHESFGFFIEPAKDMGQRCDSNAKVLKKKELSKSLTKPSLTSLFLLKISEGILDNVDFGEGTHNTKRMLINGKDIIVPYDFDLSNLTLKKTVSSDMSIAAFRYIINDSTIAPEFKKQIICPEIMRLNTTKLACAQSISEGPLDDEDKKSFLDLNEKIQQTVESYLKTNATLCNPTVN